MLAWLLRNRSYVQATESNPNKLNTLKLCDLTQHCTDVSHKHPFYSFEDHIPPSIGCLSRGFTKSSTFTISDMLLYKTAYMFTATWWSACQIQENGCQVCRGLPELSCLLCPSDEPPLKQMTKQLVAPCASEEPNGLFTFANSASHSDKKTACIVWEKFKFR